MKRRGFLVTSGVVLTGVAMSVLVRSNLAGALPPLQQPLFLSHLFNRQELRRLGNAYCALHPAEGSIPELTRLLQLGNPVVPGTRSDQAYISSHLQHEVTADFSAGRTTIVDGWVLSLTEARQCALFALTAG